MAPWAVQGPGPAPFKGLGQGPCGPPWALVGPPKALMGQALVGWALMGRALVGRALMGRSLMGPPWALIGRALFQIFRLGY